MNRLIVGLASTTDLIPADWEFTPLCDNWDQQITMSDPVFFRSLAQGVFRASVKGFYHSDSDLLSEDCLGAWMDPIIGDTMYLHNKFWTDPMSISIDEAHQFAKNIVDLQFRNRESCQVMKLTDNYESWCLNNLDLCVQGYDPEFLTRIYENGYSLFAAFYDLFGILMFQDDTCYTDSQLIEEASKVTADMTSIYADVLGYEVKYDGETEHLS